jgi:hypothetical protein
MWRFLTIFPPNMATLQQNSGKISLDNWHVTFKNILWLYKNSPEKKREKHCFQVPMDG